MPCKNEAIKNVWMKEERSICMHCKQRKDIPLCWIEVQWCFVISYIQEIRAGNFIKVSLSILLQP